MFKNQFETGTSEGVFKPTERIEVENKVINIPETIPIEDRPIYGMAFPEFSSSTEVYYTEGPGMWYGDTVCILDKDKIISNTSITLGDSLGLSKELIASPATDPFFAGAFKYIVKYNQTKEDFESSSLTDIFSMEETYLELQMHGEESHSINNIREIIFKINPGKEMIRTVEEQNIPYRILSEGAKLRGINKSTDNSTAVNSKTKSQPAVTPIEEGESLFTTFIKKSETESQKSSTPISNGRLKRTMDFDADSNIETANKESINKDYSIEDKIVAVDNSNLYPAFPESFKEADEIKENQEAYKAFSDQWARINNIKNSDFINTEFKFDENGKVQLQGGTLIHGINKYIDESLFTSIKENGILASELFGTYDDGLESFYCADFFRIPKENDNIPISDYYNKYTSDPNNSLLNYLPGDKGRNVENIALIINPNTNLNELLKYDYYRKNETHSLMKDIVNDECMSGFFNAENLDYGEGISAILCGLPSNAISGFLVESENIINKKIETNPELKVPYTKSLNRLKDNIEIIKKLFPDRYIFDTEGNIIYDPNNQNQESSLDAHITENLETTAKLNINDKLKDLEVTAELPKKDISGANNEIYQSINAKTTDKGAVSVIKTDNQQLNSTFEITDLPTVNEQTGQLIVKARLVENPTNIVDRLNLKDIDTKNLNTEYFNAFVDQNSQFAKSQIDLQDVIQSLKQDNLLSRFETEMKSLQIENIYNKDIAEHNIDHIERVVLYSMYMGKELNLNDRDMDLLIEASKLHDSGRKNLLTDRNHAELSANKVAEVLDSNKYTQDELNKISAIIEFHDAPDTKEALLNILKKYNIAESNYVNVYQIASILKDADALDRVRFPGNLNINYLRNDIAIKLIKASYQIQEIRAGKDLSERINSNSLSEKEINTIHSLEEKNVPKYLLEYWYKYRQKSTYNMIAKMINGGKK